MAGSLSHGKTATTSGELSTSSVTPRKIIQKLKKDVSNLCYKSISESTIKNYQQKWDVFQTFAHSLELCPYPASSQLINTFIAHLGNRKLQHSTIKGYLAAISFFHKCLGCKPPNINPQAKQILKGVAASTSKKKQSKPIDENLLAKILFNIKITHPPFQAILYQAVLSLQFHACLRIGELVQSKNPHHILKYKQVKIKKSKICLRFKSYKHSKNNKSKIMVAANDNKLICPVKLVKQYSAIRPQTGKNDHFFVSDSSQKLSRIQLSNVLKASLENIGINPKPYNTHSLRSGRATQLYNKQCPELLLKNYGRWKSNAYQTYIKFDKISIPKKYR